MGYWLTQLARFFENSIHAMGAHLAIAVSNIFFLGIPVMFSLGAYAMVILEKRGLALLPSVLCSVGIVIAASCIFVVAYLKLSADSFTVFSLMSVLAFEAVLKSWDGLTGGVFGISGIARPEFASSLLALALLEGLVTLFILACEYVILKTWFGRTLLAMKENLFTVQSFGYSPRAIGSAVIVIASVTAAIAGMLTIWRLRFLDPSFGSIVLLIQLATIAIIAAKPKVRWLAGATLAIVMIPEAFRFFNLPANVVGQLRNFLYAVMLIIMIKNVSKNLLPQKRFI